MDCDLCGRDLSGLPYTCKRCDQKFCTEHRLPEEHDCVALKIEKAGRELKRQEGNVDPWFKDEFRLSNIDDHDETQSPSRTPDDQITTDDRYRATNASEECSECGTSLFEHEAAGCPHCGEIYCGDHLGGHRRQCDERDTESQQITPKKREQIRRYGSVQTDSPSTSQSRSRVKIALVVALGIGAILIAAVLFGV